MKHAYAITHGTDKTGHMLTTTTDKASCPPACPLMGNGCYAENFWQGIAWSKLGTEARRGVGIDSVVAAIKELPRNAVWRHNIAGDLPGEGDDIHAPSLRKIVKANKGKRGFTYTHKPLNAHNLACISEANVSGFCVNVSADNMRDMDDILRHTDLPVAVLIPDDAEKVSFSPDGHKIVACLEQTRGIKCDKCQLCTDPLRSYAIGFYSHGARKKRVEIIARSTT